MPSIYVCHDLPTEDLPVIAPNYDVISGNEFYFVKKGPANQCTIAVENNTHRYDFVQVDHTLFYPLFEQLKGVTLAQTFRNMIEAAIRSRGGFELVEKAVATNIEPEMMVGIAMLEGSIPQKTPSLHWKGLTLGVNNGWSDALAQGYTSFEDEREFYFLNLKGPNGKVALATRIIQNGNKWVIITDINPADFHQLFAQLKHTNMHRTVDKIVSQKYYHPDSLPGVIRTDLQTVQEIKRLLKIP
jgi:hypothetical protein